MVEELKKYFTKVNEGYPAVTMEAYNHLLHYKTSQSNPATRLVDDSEQVSFDNVGGSKGKYNPYNRGRGNGGRGKSRV